MSAYWRFFRGESSLLGYGLCLTFFSSFGQTFLVSLFVPFYLLEFGLSNAEFGTFYGAATLGSALLLPWVGQWLDRARLTRFTLAVVVLMALSAFLMAVAWHLAVLCLALLGIRLAGQGLSSHTALTAMARYYDGRRGAALSISSLGFPAGEALLPLAVAGSIAVIGWRQSWALFGVATVLLFGPLLLSLLARSGVEVDPKKVGRREPPPRDGAGAPERAASPADSAPAPASAPSGGDWNRREVLGDGRFWLVLPAALLPPFWATGLFLYQTGIAEMKGWSLPLMASAFAAFALARIFCSLAAGGAVDRFSARHVFPFCCAPMGVGLGVLMFFGGGWAAYAFMACLGVTMGMSGTVKSALWAELYGTRHLGSIKAMMAAIMVVSTAASPLLVGLVMDAGAGLESLLLFGVATVVVATALALRILPGRAPAPVPAV